jgi:hypothetical protein
MSYKKAPLNKVIIQIKHVGVFINLHRNALRLSKCSASSVDIKQNAKFNFNRPVNSYYLFIAKLSHLKCLHSEDQSAYNFLDLR